jgi:glycerophosphoryl diester phosphodiesterase
VLPFVVAHRAGNDLAALRRAEGLRVGLVEADLHLFRGRLEVRHLKTLGPVPLLWDRWEMAPGWTPRLELGTLLDAARPDTPLMLDLKGRDRRLAAALRDAVGHRSVTVCSRTWPLLSGLRDLPSVRVVHSAGSRSQLRGLLRGDAGERLGGVSVHRRLLDERAVSELRRRTETVLTWPIATLGDARMLGSWGVSGVITERYAALAPALAETEVPARAA